MAHRKIIYLINPISGTRGKRSLKELITRRTQQEGIEFSILPTDAGGDYSFLIPVIEKDGVTDIVICGGDGTVSAVAAALIVVTPEDVPSERTKVVGVVPLKTALLLKFVVEPILPISVRMLWNSVSAAPD